MSRPGPFRQRPLRLVLGFGFGLILACGALLSAAGCSGSPGHSSSPGSGPAPDPAPAPPPVPIDLEQGWTEEARLRFWFSTQGSRMMPYDWFLQLEQAGTTQPLRDPVFLESLGYIRTGSSAANPDGLPIGFTRDVDEQNQAYVGLTCAACHTGKLLIANRPAIVEGGPALSDFSGLLTAAVTSLDTTLADAEKFARFAPRVGATTPEQQAALRARMTTYLDALKQRKVDNTPAEPYGYGRVDAFGHIFNQLFTTVLGQPSNRTSPDAPVSYPFLWDAPQHDVVQWNGSASNAGLGPLFRNIGELLGVFGTLDVQRAPPGLPDYPSSVRAVKLVPIETQIATLFSPRWPASVLPLDQALVSRGATIYAAACQRCHAPIDRTSPTRQVKAVLTPLAEVATDPAMTESYVRKLTALQVYTGPIKGRLVPPQRFSTISPGAPIVGHMVLGAFVGQIVDPQERAAFERQAAADAQMAAKAAGVIPPLQYKTRPLNGVWATAPFLHNGSVSSLAELLKPVNERQAGFWVGSRTFDAENVGLSIARDSNAFWFDTARPGNSNAGHVWGTTLPAPDKRALLEYLKTL